MINVIERIFLWVLNASLTATMVALLILLILKIFNKYVGLKFRNVLWMIILIRLMLPIVPESYFSVFNFLSSKYQSTSTIKYDVLKQGQTYLNNRLNNVSLDGLKENKENLTTASDKTLSNKKNMFSYILAIASFVWLAGFIIMTLMFFIVTIRFKIKAIHFEKASDSTIEALLENCKKKAKIKKNIPIYLCNDFKSPCIIGIIKPKVFIPQYACDANCLEELSHVLLHELIHYRRKDVFCNVLETIAIIIHWFNPLMWIIAKKMKLDRECTCDTYVLEILGEKEAVEYGMTLLHFSKMFSTNNNYPQLGIFFQTESQLERRIKMIQNFKKGSYKMSIAAVACCVILGGVSLTNAVSAKDITNAVAIVPVDSSDTINNDEAQFIIDSPIKIYDNLDKATKIAGFNFKLPDYLPEGYTSDGHFTILKLSDKGTGVKTYFNAKIDRENNPDFEFAVSNTSIPEFLKKDATYLNRIGKDLSIESSEETLNLAGISGSNLTLNINYKEPFGDNPKNIQDIKKYFIWQNQGIGYAIQYYNNRKTEEGIKDDTNMSLNTIGKIAASIKYPKELKNINYSVEPEFSTEIGIFEIYDKEDLKRAAELLGFNPKLPLTFNKDEVNVESVVGISADSDIPNKKINYELNTIYTTKNGITSFNESKSSRKYEAIKKNGYIEVEIAPNKTEQIKPETLTINGKEVFKYEIKNDFKPMPDSISNSSYYYIWKENSFYCSVTFFGDNENIDETAKELVASEPVK